MDIMPPQRVTLAMGSEEHHCGTSSPIAATAPPVGGDGAAGGANAAAAPATGADPAAAAGTGAGGAAVPDSLKLFQVEVSSRILSTLSLP